MSNYSEITKYLDRPNRILSLLLRSYKRKQGQLQTSVFSFTNARNEKLLDIKEGKTGRRNKTEMARQKPAI